MSPTHEKVCSINANQKTKIYRLIMGEKIELLKVQQHEIFFISFFVKPNPYGPKGLQHEIFGKRLRFGRDIRILNIFALTQCAPK